MIALSCNRGPALRGLKRVAVTARWLSSGQYPAKIGSSRYQEGDSVLVMYKEGIRLKSKLLGPLKTGSSMRTKNVKFDLNHSDIIGMPRGRLYVNAVDDKGNQSQTAYRVIEPTFDQIVSMAPRTVTPIYGSYSSSIINLLDIHVAPPQPDNDPRTSDIPPLEILEAGTGHGSLTIHLSRAIAAANPPTPVTKDFTSDEEINQAWEEWQSSRRAIVHTVEYDSTRSKEASKLIRSFRGGLYWPHIDFHSGDAGLWVKKEQEKRKSNNRSSQFLDIVCLDMPNVQKQIEHVVQAMKNDAKLLIYVPQITQLAVCQQTIEHLKLPLLQDHVVELGEGISNGRTWDLRITKIRAAQQTQQSGTEGGEEVVGLEDTSLETSKDESESDSSSSKESLTANTPVEFPAMVCRPMVGRLTMGGAFIGLWTKRGKANKKDASITESLTPS